MIHTFIRCALYLFIGFYLAHCCCIGWGQAFFIAPFIIGIEVNTYLQVVSAINRPRG